MTRLTVHEYVDGLRERYVRARKKEKGRILNELCETTGLHRKAAIRLLSTSGGGKGVAKKKGRPVRYGPEVTRALVEVWETGDRMCGKLLAAMLPELVASLERHGELSLTPRVRRGLLGMSAATIDRRLRGWRRGIARQPRRQQPATTSLKAQIPIRTWSEWRDVSPGSVQADLVLHCGESTEGFYLTTLTVVDVATGWLELRPTWGMGMSRVRSALHRSVLALPFPLRELHTDNGGEFINRGLRDWCLQQSVRFTRGRGYHKNDQAYVEERNWLGVRRIVGYDRYNSKASFEALGRLYSLLRLQLNFFRPLRKLVGKERRGAKVTKRYDAPRTPYRRLLESSLLDEAACEQLEKQFLAINPAELKRNIEGVLNDLWSKRERRERRRVG